MSSRLLPPLFLSLLSLSAACATTPSPGPASTAAAPSAPPSAPPASPSSPAASSPPSNAVPPSPAGLPAAIASNRLGFDLYAQVDAGTGNLVYSPASIAVVLAMTASGARGATLAEMREVLHAGDMPDIDAGFSALLASVNARSGRGGAEVRAANRLWVQRGIALDAGFLGRMRGAYGAPLGEVDFAHDPGGACRSINAWVSGETAGRIPSLLAACNGATLVLTNAVYFKGSWIVPFDPRSTMPRDFHTLAGAAELAPTMHVKGSFAYAHDGGVQLLALPYRGGLLLELALPDEPKGLAEQEKHLGDRYPSWHEALSAARGQEVDVTIPKWTSSTEIALEPALEALGMKRAFSRREADFSAMADPSRVALSVSSAVHEAFVKVDEAGTEAAAVTAMVMRGLGMQRPQASFVADHPFLFFLVDPSTGAVLFAGRVADPQG